MAERAGTLWYYRAVADILLSSGHTALVVELDRTVSQLEGAVCARFLSGALRKSHHQHRT